MFLYSVGIGTGLIIYYLFFDCDREKNAAGGGICPPCPPCPPVINPNAPIPSFPTTLTPAPSSPSGTALTPVSTGGTYDPFALPPPFPAGTIIKGRQILARY
jgi:hypothetical protein